MSEGVGVTWVESAVDDAPGIRDLCGQSVG